MREKALSTKTIYNIQTSAFKSTESWRWRIAIGLLLSSAAVRVPLTPFVFRGQTKFCMQHLHLADKLCMHSYNKQGRLYKNYHRMNILLSVNWNISECPLNVHGMFTEIRISGTVQWPFSKHSVPLNAAEWQAHFSDHSVIFFNFQIQKKFHQIRGF